jgi:hypothetical protein
MWAPIGAKWEYKTGFLGANSTCSIFVEKDTFIQNKLCKKIKNTCSLPVYAENYFLHIRNIDTIEYLLNGKFTSLFEFSHMIGDTVSVNIFNPFNQSTDQCSNQVVYIVKNVDEYQLNNIKIKNFNFVDLQSKQCSMYVGNYVFEIFGPFRGYLFPMNQTDEIFHILVRYTDTCWDIEPVINLEDPNNINYSIKVNKSCLISATKESTFQNEISIYPNPAYSQINITNSTGYKIDRVQIIDNLGRNLINMAGNNTLIDISTLPSGIYYVKINIRNVVITKPLLVSFER